MKQLVVAFVLGFSCVVLLTLSQVPLSVVSLEVAKVLMSLIVAIIVAGWITSTLNRRAQHRNERISKLSALSSALQELKGAYEQMSVARTMLRANPSGRMFEEQLPAILGCRARLQRIERDRVIGVDELAGEDGPISQMVAFTRGVRSVYISNYTQILQSRLLEERQRARLINGDGGAVEAVASAKLDLEKLSEVKFLMDLTAERCVWHKSQFCQGYDRSKQILEKQILKIREDVA